MESLKIVVIGAGSTYTPELIDGFIQRKEVLPVTDITLMDIDLPKLEIVGGLTRRMLLANLMDCRLELTTDLEAALPNADFVLTQIRVGRLDARIKDEKIPLKYDLIGQETTGAGGFMKALRSIPVIMNIAGMMEKYCPEAWLINFTNPSGIITETLLNHTRVKAIGLCNSPINMKREIMPRVPEGVRDLVVDYLGLNHLSWITGIHCDDQDILQDQLTGEYSIYRPKNIPKIPFDQELLRSIQAIPSSYLTYYYYRDRSLQHLKAEPKTRGEVCREIEAELLQLYQQPDLKEKPAVLDQRGGRFYSEAAVSLIDAIYNDKNEIHVINTKNTGALEFMAPDDVVEISALINRDGVSPIPMPQFANEHIKRMMQTVKTYEKYTVQSGLAGNYTAALNALLIHPLIGDYQKAKYVLDDMLEAHRKFLPQFWK